MIEFLSQTQVIHNRQTLRENHLENDQLEKTTVPFFIVCNDGENGPRMLVMLFDH